MGVAERIGSIIKQICCLTSKMCEMLSVYEPHGILNIGLQDLWASNVSEQ